MDVVRTPAAALSYHYRVPNHGARLSHKLLGIIRFVRSVHRYSAIELGWLF
jgi:hypothetical protein